MGWQVKDLQNGTGLLEGGDPDGSLGTGARFSRQFRIDYAHLASAAPDFQKAVAPIMKRLAEYEKHFGPLTRDQHSDKTLTMMISYTDLLNLRDAMNKSKGKG